MTSHRQFFLKHIAQTSATPMMVEIESAKGVFLYGPSGKKYLDLISGVNVSALGHAHPKIVKAVKNQVDKHMHLMVYGEFIQNPQLEYARLLVENLPPSLNSVYFVNSGAEAIEGAMKLAKRVTGRSEMASFRNAYHGSTHGAMSLMGGEYFKTAYRPLLPGVKLLNYNHFEDLKKITDKTACVVAEVLQAEAGAVSPSPGFMKALRERCDETGALLVLDEIQTGFGRIGSLFGFRHAGIVPDVLVLAKSFGGGLPLGGFISSTERMNTFTENPVLGHITTFGGNPVSCAAGHETLRIILEENLPETVRKKEQLFREQLRHPAIKEIRGQGFLMAVELGSRELMLKVIEEGVKTGFISDWFLFCDTAFRISPPLNISEEEITLACDMINNVLRDVTGQ